MFTLSRSPSLSLALQGGGAHGAYTWGVLDALLERGVPIAALSGASAGAMNAVVLADGLADGSHDAAREALSAFWRAVAEQVSPLWHLPGDPPSLSAAGRTLLAWTQWLSPTQLNPTGANPLRDVLTARVDFERLRRSRGAALFVAATVAETGRLRLFRRHELTLDALLASACLPTIAHPVSIDGLSHWDGAFSANPALAPLVREVPADDLLIVTLSPLAAVALPQSAEGIAARVRDVAFNAAFLREARWLAELRCDALSRTWIRTGIERRMARLRWHLIDADEDLQHLPAETRLVPDWNFLQRLRDLGRDHVARWWTSAGPALGRRSSIDPQAVFGESAAVAAPATRRPAT
jgi:NTE family protein